MISCTDKETDDLVHWHLRLRLIINKTCVDMFLTCLPCAYICFYKLFIQFAVISEMIGKRRPYRNVPE